MPALPTRFGFLLLAASFSLGCAPPGESAGEEEEGEATEEELTGFDKHRVLSDAAFVDADAMSAEEIQAFLEETPYGNRSVLASTTANGKKASQAIFEASQEHGINPIALLVRAQMEQSLIAKSSATDRALNHAFGCGCPDYSSCSPQYKGFGKQVACMAKLMRGYLDDLDAGDATIAGWKVGKAKKTLDPQWVTPANAATAALYTYTPWVGSASFGNAAHFGIWKRFTTHLGYAPAGPGGCGAVSFPSGLAVQLLPSPTLADAYLSAPGGDAATAPTCFLDRRQLEDPSSGAIAPSNAKVSSNFRVDELFAGEPTSTSKGLVDPAFIARLQKLRAEVGASVTVVDGYRTPERHARVCEAACGESSCALASCSAEVADAPLVHGRAAFVTASVTSAALVAAAQRAGFPTCALEDGDLYVADADSGLGCAAP